MCQCEENGEGVFFTVDNHDKMWGAGAADSEAVVRFTNSLAVRRVTIFNSLTTTRNQVITLRVDTPLVKVDINYYFLLFLLVINWQKPDIRRLYTK